MYSGRVRSFQVLASPATLFYPNYPQSRAAVGVGMAVRIQMRRSEVMTGGDSLREVSQLLPQTPSPLYQPAIFSEQTFARSSLPVVMMI